MEAKTRTKRKLGSYPFVSVTFSITLALFVIGLFGLMVLHTQKLTNIIQENVEIQIYLDKGLGSNEITRISRTIESKNYVFKRTDQPAVRLITKEQAAQEFISDTGEDFKEFLGENPLRDLLAINVNPAFQTADSLQFIKKDLAKIRGVFEVAYVESLVKSINENLTKIGIILLGFFVILLTVVVILINNTIKLALFSQRFLIRSMQLVGATGSFIKRPFLTRAFFYGTLAGIMANVGLFLVISYINSRIEELQQLQEPDKMMILAISLVVIGGLVGFLSTWRAVRKYLKMSLDELY